MKTLMKIYLALLFLLISESFTRTFIIALEKKVADLNAYQDKILPVYIINNRSLKKI